MTTSSERANQIHQGRNVKSFGEMLGLNQKVLAIELGEEWNQKQVSLLEAKEVLKAEVLAQRLRCLKCWRMRLKILQKKRFLRL